MLGGPAAPPDSLAYARRLPPPRAPRAGELSTVIFGYATTPPSTLEGRWIVGLTIQSGMNMAMIYRADGKIGITRVNIFRAAPLG